MVNERSVLPAPKKDTLVLACGFGLHLAWVACLFYQGTVLGAVGNESVYYQYYLASMLALTAALAILGIGAGRFWDERLFLRRPAMLLFAAAALAGSVLVRAMGLDTPAHAAVFAVSAVLTGIGSAYINIVWGRELVRHGKAPAIVVLCLAYAISALVYYVMALLPPLLFAALVALLPLASILLALHLDGSTEAAATGSAVTVDEYTARDLRFFSYKLLVAAFLFGGVIGSIKGLANNAGMPQDAIGHPALFLIFTGVPLVVMIVYIGNARLQSSVTERLVVVYRVALLAIIGALLVSSVQGTSSPVLQIVMLSGYTFFKIVVWSELCQVCRAGGASEARMFGLGEASMSFALLISNALLGFCWQAVDAREGTARMVIALSVAALLVAYLFILTERQIIAIEEIGKIKEGESPRFRFQEKVDDLAGHYDLTKRETEVLKLFVRGRSTSRIAEDLYVSSGTVATHVRNIYRKAGVHSRQELLDLLDCKKPSSPGRDGEEG